MPLLGREGTSHAPSAHTYMQAQHPYIYKQFKLQCIKPEVGPEIIHF